jgi:hypothetical protein
MRVVAIALALSLLVGGSLVTQGSSAVASENPQRFVAAAVYAPTGPTGLLTLTAWPGAFFEVFDATGAPVASGVQILPIGVYLVPNSGPGPEGNWLTVTVNGSPIEVAIDEWEWDH